MIPHAAPTIVLIDLETFYLGREAAFAQRGMHAYGDDFLAADLRLLLRTCRKRCGGLPAVMRAYADFQLRRDGPSHSARHGEDGTGRGDYFLARTPRLLLEIGIEPVQVFRPTSANARASRSSIMLRMALDGSQLVETFAGRSPLLVGVSLEPEMAIAVEDWRRRGATVCSVGQTALQARFLEETCDHYESFDDLETAASDPEELPPAVKDIAWHLRRLVANRPFLPVEEVRGELAKLLTDPFDPMSFGCRNVVDFLRTYRTALEMSGVVLDRRGDSWSLRVAGSTDSGHGAPATGTSERGPEKTYRQRLQQAPVRIFVYPKDQWLLAARHLFATLRRMPQAPQMDELVAAAKESAAVPMSALLVQGCAFALCASRSLQPKEVPLSFRRVDRLYHWTIPEEWAREGDGRLAELAFERFVFHLAEELRQRAPSRSPGATEQLDPMQLAALWCEGEPAPEDLELAKRAIDAVSAKA